ncbi:hypothetical protein CEW89_01400 [Celeribacter ethanolicus]|uniref:Uncharacterized protein n=1 Tax=Celeribacter ethanolicus TaxID=1758178 RepID=A0A291G7I7_9RHOB|nr:hypothetical protein [Celeribacter ethanolicus]ATG46339.1 hypothetical protein CEW89_01400 [Celeribacter ethanolicus]
MSFQSARAIDQLSEDARDGAQPVGKLSQLNEQGRMVVTLFRGSNALREGSDMGRIFDQMMLVFQRHARRPLVHHGMSCDCLGADEAVLAQFVCLAARGKREDACLMAMLLVRADVAPLAVSLAEQLGLLIDATLRTDPRAMMGTVKVH